MPATPLRNARCVTSARCRAPLAGGREAALAAAGRLELIHNASSLGGCETLIEHRASVEGANPVSPQDLLRLSVGLEHADDLIADLDQALGG